MPSGNVLAAFDEPSTITTMLPFNALLTATLPVITLSSRETPEMFLWGALDELRDGLRIKSVCAVTMDKSKQMRVIPYIVRLLMRVS
jgi:hypothetical protein